MAKIACVCNQAPAAQPGSQPDLASASGQRFRAYGTEWAGSARGGPALALERIRISSSVKRDRVAGHARHAQRKGAQEQRAIAPAK